MTFHSVGATFSCIFADDNEAENSQILDMLSTSRKVEAVALLVEDQGLNRPPTLLQMRQLDRLLFRTM
jgi:hypothetical protein